MLLSQRIFFDWFDSMIWEQEPPGSFSAVKTAEIHIVQRAVLVYSLRVLSRPRFYVSIILHQFVCGASVDKEPSQSWVFYQIY